MAATPATERISACMASYNGELYIEEQTRSILSQLGARDELIIVDDCSQDRTVEIIRSFHDPRIKLLHNAGNRGVVKTFERALSHASGELVFLSDQDDVWRADKVEKIRAFFAGRPMAALAVSDARVIDAAGREISSSWVRARAFHPGALQTILKNRYLGCAMAFRKSVLAVCLPFPERIPMHDMWIGALSSCFGEVGFLPDPLVAYRRHGKNETSGHHAPLGRMIAWRWNLATALLARMIAVKLGRHPALPGGEQETCEPERRT